MTEVEILPSPGELLYNRCTKDAAKSPERYKKTFTQEALVELCDSEGLEPLKDAKKLLGVLNQLLKERLFITCKTKESRCWSLRPRDAAAKVKGLTQDENMVYSHVEEAHENGVWVRNLKSKTGIKDSKAMEKILNKLQQQNLIKTITNRRNPNHKTYILYHLAASEDVTGGSFYDAGDLDESMIEDLSNFILFYVRNESWMDEKKKHIKRSTSPILIRDDEDHAIVEGAAESPTSRKKRKRDTTSQPMADIEEIPPQPPRKRRSHKHRNDPETDLEQIPFPAGHTYPTAETVHTIIETTNVLRSEKAHTLTIKEVEKILNILVWDEKLEKVNGGYRSVRGVRSKGIAEVDDPEVEEVRQRGNGFTEMPCGQCPVIDLCGKGGPISASNCVYFDRWLGRGVAA